MKPPVHIEALMTEWSEDSIIDATAMEKETLKISNLHSKYLNIMSYHRHMVRKLEADYKALKSLKEDFFDGHLTLEEIEKQGWDPAELLHIKGNRNRKLDSDRQLNNLLLKKVSHEEIVTYCETVLKSLHNRSWDIGNYIKYRIHMDGK
jgi:hypothetical protein